MSPQTIRLFANIRARHIQHHFLSQPVLADILPRQVPLPQLLFQSDFLSVGNFLCGWIIAGGLPVPPGWAVIYLGHTLLAGAGGALLSLVACGLCERFCSLPIALILVAVVLLFSALTADLRGEPLGLYVLANGFFAKVIRGRALTGWASFSPPWGVEWLVWGPWHLGLAALCLWWAVRGRKERNQW